MKNLKPPYQVLAKTSLVLLIASFFVAGHTIDIHLYDAYYVIDLKHVLWVNAFLLILLWGLCKLTNHLLFSNSLSWLHIILSILAVLLFSTMPLWLNEPGNATLLSPYEHNYPGAEVLTVAIILIAFVVGQLIFVVNMVIGVIKKQYKNRKLNS